MENILKTSEDKLEFKKMEDTSKPFEGGFVGESKHFGLPNKTFKVFLEGEGSDGEMGFIGVQFITPKARKLTSFLSAAIALQSLESGDISTLEDGALDILIEKTKTLFQISDVIIDKLTFSSLLHMISFATKISFNPKS